MDALLIPALVTCLISALVAIVLHFQMKFRLDAAGLPVKWLMTPRDDTRMWRTYLGAAPAKGSPIWPFRAYRISQVVFGISGLIVLLNSRRLDALLRW